MNERFRRNQWLGPADLRERFWTWVTEGSATECWLWQASKHRNGYGQFGLGGKKIGAHRQAWLLRRGLIPRGLMVLHTCDVRACVNPNHLFLGTQADNLRDMKEKGRSATGSKNGTHTHPERRAHGERCGAAKLSADDVVAIRAASGTHKEIALRFGVHWNYVGIIRRRKAWRHL